MNNPSSQKPLLVRCRIVSELRAGATIVPIKLFGAACAPKIIFLVSHIIWAPHDENQ